MTENLTDVERVARQIKGHIPRLLFVLAGPSGVGKNTIIKKVLTNHADEMGRVRTYTTREPRPDERDGDQYHFVTRERFRELALSGQLMEADEKIAGHPVYDGEDLYSMPSDLFRDILPHQHLVIVEVDVHGMYRLKQRFPDCITIFITAEPTELLHRIRSRRDEHMDDETLSRRMRIAREQIGAAKDFDYLIFNREGDLDHTVAAIETIILAERMRVRHGIDLVAVVPPEAFKVSLESLSS